MNPGTAYFRPSTHSPRIGSEWGLRPAHGLSLGCFALAAALSMASGTSAQPIKLGAIGDSLTDEYSEESYSYAKNWTMLLVQQRGVDMGPTAQAAAQAGNTWGEPRRSGYQFNWARYGADSTSAITSGQHTGLAAQRAALGVTDAVVVIGANDFSPTSSAYLNIYFNFWSASQITSYVDAQIADVRTIVTTLQNAGLRVTLCNFVDFGIAPATRQIYTSASNRQRVTNVIARVNAGVLALAREKRVVYVDTAGLATTLFGTQSALRSTLTIGNVNIQLNQRDTATHTVPLAGFVDDGAHPHTAVQGVFANLMMTALNVNAHTNYPLFTDQQLLSNAGIAYVGPDTLASTVPSYNRFLRNFACAADIVGLGGSAGPDGALTADDLVAFIGAFFSNNVAVADLASLGGGNTPDGQITADDLIAFLNAFFAGCP